MRHTNWEKTVEVFRGRKSFFPHTSSFAVWTVSSVSLLALLLLTGLASVAGLSLLSAPQASAVTTVPTKLNFQGRLSDSAGSIKANGTYNMKFKLYTVATAGSAVWSEDRLVSATQGVTVTNGLFSVQLGSITSLPASLFASGALYLEVELPTPATATSTTPTWTEGPMTPRNQMATSAYAYNSETLDGQDGAYYQDASNLNAGTISGARLSGSYTGITGTGALAAGSIASGFGTISTANTITGTTLNGTTGINTGAGAGTQRIDASGNLVNVGSITASGTLAVSGSTLQFSNFFPEYRWRIANSSTDTNWKKVADITLATGLYVAASFQVDVIDANCNYGCVSNAIPMRFYASAIRSSAVQDDTDSGSVAGPVSDYVRLVKTALGVYELQVRSMTVHRTMNFTVRQISGLSGGIVTYIATPADGSTVGTIYAPSPTGYTQKLASVAVGGSLSVAGQLTSSVATGTAPLVVSSTTKVTSLNADLLDGLDSTAFGDATAANQTTILNRIGTNVDAAGTTTVFARLASIDTSKLGASADAANATGSIFARLAYLISSIGATTDAASSTGSVNAKLAYIIANLGGGVASDDVQVFSASGTWTKPAGAKYVDVYVIGGGGGGSGGYYRYDNTASTPVPGGPGGAGGGYCKMTQIRASSLPASVSLTIGAGGTGGTATTSTQTASAGTVGGNPGLAGSSSSFGTLVSAPGGAGAGGTGGVGCTGTGGTGAAYNTGAAGNTGGDGTTGAPGGGGSGGGTFGSDTATYGYPGGSGGFGESGGMATAQSSAQGAVGLSGKHYGLSGATGANGGNAANAGNLMGGGDGGAGSICGAGGGGGGAFGRRLAGTQYATGAGGAGAPGCVIVVTRF